MNATARIAGGRVEIWAPTQGPTGHQQVAAALAGVDPADVDVHTLLLGGGFGRKAEMDFVEDAVRLAGESGGRPVKVIWSREDDVRHGKYRPLEAQSIRIGLDSAGRIVGWRHRVVADSIFARTLPEMFAADGGKDDVITEGSDLRYAVPAHLVEYLRQDDGQPVGFWRGVGAGYVKFAVECALDEVAAARGLDPVALRLDLLAAEPRAREVVRRVAEMAEWDRPREGRALGIAYSDTFGSHCAEVAEVSLDRESGEIRVHRVWCAVDPGIAIQPRNIEAQVVGAVIGGISHALYERITVVNGEVQERNFDTYRVLRMSEAPPVEVAVIETPGSRPGGIGEVGLPPIAPAIANAVARLTGGVRLRHLPFLPERVVAALQV
ncbi:xanthine dehydrogenase family protein molybdopterin-binding subunit [Methylobrevis pamukkalensis]|uniref:Isoquinoline 1-oxidoreductase subunit beta n=1 Tax=Methylobrevis pamukkalensis TaxID=1439726 RepID=A0A1E3H5U1_9HYPH|nr:molybdopterin cofactor-binding domain-containing protein [Methylobrevis pamukkalensis]ODN71682.1 Isoquinoline 1-oxidoreductase subunit beta [Methylobrevis pamukkalensis]